MGGDSANSGEKKREKTGEHHGALENTSARAAKREKRTCPGHWDGVKRGGKKAGTAVGGGGGGGRGSEAFEIRAR